MKNILQIFTLLILMFLLNACPQHLVEGIEKNFPKKGTIYKPNYSTAPVNLERLAKDIKDSSIYKFDTINKNLEIGKNFDVNLGPVAIKVVVGGNDSSKPDELPIKENNLPHGINFYIKKVESSSYPNEIKVQAIAVDGRGRFISGLAAPYLKNKEDYKNYWINVYDSCKGEKYDAKDFKVKEVRESKSNPISTVYVLDHSGSMGNQTATKLQEAVKKMILNTKEGDEVAVIKFDSKSKVEVELSNNLKAAKDSIKVNGLEDFGGGTAIYDATELAIKELKKAKETNKKVIVIFTDGMDGASKTSLDSVITLAKKDKIEIYTIAYGIGFSSSSTMEKIARQTKGKFYRIYFDKEFPYVFAEIYLILNNYYEITYSPKECEGIHIVSSKLNIKEIDIENAIAYGIYDKSLINEDNKEVAFLNIEFESGSAQIDKNSYPMLDDIVASLHRYPDMEIELIGHTDDIGKEEDNLKLSIKRAESVKDFIVSKGISTTRIFTSGKGESEPIKTNDSDENRRQNRRIEFKVVKR